ncbi:hypothetical protein ACWWIV_000919, partial [Cronobacter sakazakii]
SVMLNASEQDKRLEADFHIALGRLENSWQVGSPRLPNASEDNLLLFCCISKTPQYPFITPSPYPVKHFHLSYSCSTFSPFLVIVGCLDV